MLKGLGDIGNIMKMQKEMKSIQKKAKKTQIKGKSPGGDIVATLDGEFCLLDIKIDSDFIKTHEINKIEKMIKAAINDAHEKVKEHSAVQVAELTKGMNLPDFLTK